MSSYQTERAPGSIPKPDRKASNSAARMPWHCVAKLGVSKVLSSDVTRSMAPADRPARHEYVQKAETTAR